MRREGGGGSGYGKHAYARQKIGVDWANIQKTLGDDVMRFFASRRPVQALCGVASIGLAACSSGGGGAAEEDLNAIERYFFGAASGETSGNGLPFASPTTTDADLIDARFDVPLIALTFGDMPVDSEIRVASTEFVPSADFVDGTLDEFTFTYEGETIDYEGMGLDLGDGRTVLVSRQIEGRESLIMAGVVYEVDNNTLFAFPAGPESSPVVIDALSGSANFNGAFRLLGVAYREGTAIGFGELTEGGALLSVDFDRGLVSGLFESVPISQDGGADWVLNGTMDPVAIDGNAITGTIAWRCSGVATCSDDANFGAVFTGADAEELTGITSFSSDVELSDTMTTLDVQSIGGFIVNDSGI